MKKSKTLIAIIAMVIVASAVAVVSCKKEKQDQKSNNVEQSIQSTNNMDDYLLSFKEKLLSAEKDSEFISLEQAQHDLGNLLNFDFGDANYATNTFQYDTIHTYLCLSNGQVDLSQLAGTYQFLLEQIKDVYQHVILPEKTVYSIKLSINEFVNKNVDNDNVEVIVTTRGYENEVPGRNTIDYWRPTNNGGTCDNQPVGWGGPEKVMNWLNNDPISYDCIDGRVYFSDHQTAYIKADHPSLIDNNAPYGHKLYMWPNQYSQQYPVCLSNSELWYYYQQCVWLKNKREWFTPANLATYYVPIQYYINHEERNPGGTFTGYIWKYSIEHARINCTPNGGVVD